MNRPAARRLLELSCHLESQAAEIAEISRKLGGPTARCTGTTAALEHYLRDRGTVTSAPELLHALQATWPALTPGKLGAALSRLVRQGRIQRVGRAQYQVKP